MKMDIYTSYREWPYKNVPRKIIGEQYWVDESGLELKDYKFFCFNIQVKFCKVDFDRFIEHRANDYDPSSNLLPFKENMCLPNFNKKLDCPFNFDKMVDLAQRLSKDIPFAWMDLYIISGHIYFGERTFFPAGGFGRFSLNEWGTIIGEWIKLPNLNLLEYA